MVTLRHLGLFAFRSPHPCEYLGKFSLKGKDEVDMYCVSPSNSS